MRRPAVDLGGGCSASKPVTPLTPDLLKWGHVRSTRRRASGKLGGILSGRPITRSKGRREICARFRTQLERLRSVRKLIRTESGDSRPVSPQDDFPSGCRWRVGKAPSPFNPPLGPTGKRCCHPEPRTPDAHWAPPCEQRCLLPFRLWAISGETFDRTHAATGRFGRRQQGAVAQIPRNGR